MKHTKGPWAIDSDKYLISADHSIVGHVADCRPSDANLISAAPELLEALEKMQAYLRSIARHEDIHTATAVELKALQALNKAKGL